MANAPDILLNEEGVLTSALVALMLFPAPFLELVI